MDNQQTEIGRQKSTLLLLVIIFFLFNAALMFRAGVNTLYFTEDTSADYALVQATVKELLPDPAVKAGEKVRVIPVFSFRYKEEEMTMEAPRLAFAEGSQSFRPGEEHTLWVHRNRGELLLPPRAGQKEIGRSQMVISAVFLLLAMLTWFLRKWIAAKAAN